MIDPNSMDSDNDPVESEVKIKYLFVVFNLTQFNIL